MSANDILMTKDGASEITDGIWSLGAQGNALAIETASGIVLVDTGPGGEKTDRMIASLREVTQQPLHTIIYSHGHVGYNFGVDQWLNHSLQRGNPKPRIIAHARLPARYRRYRETAGLQAWLNSRQFRTNVPSEIREHWYRMPDETYETRMIIHDQRRDIELIYAPSETDDVTAVWLPNEQLLYGSAAVIRSIPNVGTPLRTIRDPVRWADTLERLYALNPRILVPEFGNPISDAVKIRESLLLPAKVLRWLRKEVVDRMNIGMGLGAIVHDIQYPADWLAHDRLQQRYGAFEYIVRDIWRSENGWWDRNATNLHPAPPSEVGAAILSAIADKAHIIARARTLESEGKAQLAMHVLDLLTDGPTTDPHTLEARELKARLCETLSQTASSYVSRQLYLSAADDLMGRPIAPDGHSVW